MGPSSQRWQDQGQAIGATAQAMRKGYGPVATEGVTRPRATFDQADALLRCFSSARPSRSLVWRARPCHVLPSDQPRAPGDRSEERRVGKECRAGWRPGPKIKNERIESVSVGW